MTTPTPPVTSNAPNTSSTSSTSSTPTNATNPQTTSRLWPVLLMLVALPAGARLVEHLARTRGGAVRVIHVDAAPAGSSDDIDVRQGPPVDDNHARARALVQRGDLAAASTLYASLAQAHADSAAIAVEFGALLLQQRQLDEALAQLQRGKTLAPDDERVAVELSRGYSRKKDWVHAEEELRRALVKRPGYGVALRALGRALSAQGKTADAIDVVAQAAGFGDNEERASSLVALGTLYVDAGRPDDAKKAFDQAIERAPARVEIRLGIAKAWLSTDKKEDATRASGVLAVASDLAPDVADVQIALGQARETLGDDDGAEEAYWQALRLAPQATFPRRRLLRIALDHQRYARARQHVDELLASDPEEPEHHFLAGLVAARQGDTLNARTHYQTALDKAGGEYPEALLNLGSVEKDAGNLDGAIAAYQKAIAQRPGYHAAENNLGLALVAAGRIDDAEKLYKEVLARAPGYAPAWTNLGKLYSGKKDYSAAIDAYRKALEAKPDSARALLDLGVAYARSGRNDDAIATYKKVLEGNPRSVSAWYNLGLIQLQSADKQGAETSFGKARELDGEHVPSARKLAGLLAARGADAEARALYEDVLDNDPRDAASRVALGTLLRKAGDREGCAKAAAFAQKDADDKTADGKATADAARALFAACTK